MNMKLFLSGLLAGTALFAFGWSKDGELGWRRIDDSLVTPHRTFANPAAGKKPTVMFFACGISQREIVELKQRFEYNYKIWPVQNLKKFSPFVKGHNEGKGKAKAVYAAIMTSEDYQQEEKVLLKELDQCDLFVLGKFPFDGLPTYLRSRILNHVKNGKGLILVCPDGSDQTVENITFRKAEIDFPVNAVPSIAGSMIKIGSHGKGKILVISYPRTKRRLDSASYIGAISPYESEDPLYYDYIMAFMGKCFWKLTDPARSMFRSVSADGKVSLKKAPPANSKLIYAVVDQFGKELFRREQKAAKDNRITLPELPATAKMLDVKLVGSDGKTIDYSAAPLEIRKAAEIKGFTLPKDGWKKDEIITGSVALTAPAKGVLKLSAVDNYGREIYRKEYSVSGTKVDFTAKILHQKSSSAALRAKLFQNGKLVDEAETYLYFDTSRDVSDFIFGVWSYGSSNSRVSNLWLREMKRYGVDAVMDAHVLYASEELCAFIPRNLKRAGLDFAAYVTRLVGEHTIKQTGRCGYRYWDMYQKSGSLFDKNGRPLDREPRATRIAAGAKNIGVLFYNLGDENASAERLETENCFCEDCQRRFRIYLQREHGTIANLNKNYGSNYKSFAEIKAQPFVKAVENGKYCEWVDFRMFMEEEFINWHRYHKEKIRSIDPEARVGIEGMQGPVRAFSGFNFPKMLKHFEFCCPYFTPREALAVNQYLKGSKGIAPLRGAWFGSYEGEMNDQYIRQQPWRYLFAGMGSIFYWTTGFPPTCSTYSNACIAGPDLRMLSHFTKAADEVKIIKEKGIGKMLLNSAARYDGILIHYSNCNLHVSTLNPDKSTWDGSIADFQGTLAGLGLGHRYIEPQILEKGVPGGTKALFLPYSQAMSAKEVAAVREYVKNGGMVIADHTPAIANQYGKFHSESALLDVFGKFEKMNINRYGKGYAVYLDDYLSGATARTMKSEASGIQKGILFLLKKAGVVPFVMVSNESGKSQEFNVYEHKDTSLICLLAPRTTAGEARKTAAGAEAGTVKTAVGGSLYRKISLAKPMHVYDIVNGNKYLGKIREFSAELEPAVGRVFACLDHPAQKPRISVNGSAARGESAVFRVSGFDNTGILTIKDPSGKVRDVQRITGKTARFIPAYNEPAGTWTAELKNAVGGNKATISFNVK